MKKYIGWRGIVTYVNELCDKIPKDTYEAIYAVPRGGLIIGVLMSHKLGIPMVGRLQEYYGKKFLIVDDIADTGKTLEHFRAEVFENASVATIHYHKHSSVVPDYWVKEKKDDWIVYPWELYESEEIQDYLKETK